MAKKAAATDPWENFCEQLKQAGRVIYDETTPKNELALAEGYRKLVRFIRVGFEASLEYADTEHPQVYQSVTAQTLGEGETSDARYHQAFIDGSATYRISGNRGQAPFIEFTVYAGKIGLDEQSRQVGALTEGDLAVAEDGSFELILSPEERPGNWIKTDPEATLLYIRQYAHDWSKTEGANFEIEREGAQGYRQPLTLPEMRGALDRTAAFVEKSVGIWATIVGSNAAGASNVFRVFPEEKAADSPEMPTGHRFASGYFRIKPGKALIVTFKPAEVPYWGLDLTSYWFEPLSYDDHRSHVNNRTATYEADGSVRVVIADECREQPNWIDTKGHREGMMLFRWSRTREPFPEIAIQVVKLIDL